MTVNYKGITSDYNYRVAEINFDEEQECVLFNRILAVMNVQGYDIEEVTPGYAICEVEDKDDYKEFMKTYKIVKKAVKCWIKFGF